MSTATAMCCRVTVVRSSGYAALDDEAMALLERAQPLPPFPPEMTGTIRNFTIPIRFRCDSKNVIPLSALLDGGCELCQLTALICHLATSVRIDSENIIFYLPWFP